MPCGLPIGQTYGNIEVASSQMTLLLYQTVKSNQHRERDTNEHHTNDQCDENMKLRYINHTTANTQGILQKSN